MLGAEGLYADLGLVGVLAHAAEDEVAEGLDAVLGLEGVPAQCKGRRSKEASSENIHI